MQKADQANPWDATVTKGTSKQMYEVVDGDVAVLLRSLRNHTFQREDDLKVSVCKHLERDDDFEYVWEHVRNTGLITLRKAGATLTSDGEEWLDSFDSELSVEDEDTSSDDKPKKPYEVSKLKMEPKHLSVFQALRKIQKKEIDLNPEFQRAFVWDEVKQSRLIESVLIRIPLPAFYLDATNKTNWSVVDGLQRLTTLYRYCREESFGLTGIQFLDELKGKRFSELPPEYRVLIEDDTQLLFYNLMPGTPVEAKFTIFSRVNTGGMQLTAQEIRHALNQGKITKLLAKIATGKTFRSVTGGVVESLRMSDRELVLRALAFMHLGVDAYRGYNELDAFLLHAMTELNKCTDDVLEELENDFNKSLDKIYTIFGRYSFRKFTERNGRRSPFNKALFEVWVTAARSKSLRQLTSSKSAIIDAFIGLINTSPTFLRSISSSTGSYSAVSSRFSKIQELLDEACA